MNRYERERIAHRIVAEAEKEYQRWLAVHPNATTLEQLAEIFSQGNRILRTTKRTLDAPHTETTA